MLKVTRLMLLLLRLMGHHGIANGEQVGLQTTAPTLGGPGAEMSPYERELIRLEEAKLALERQKAWITGVALGIPLLAAVFAYWSGQNLQAIQADNNFQLKAAEIAMSARNSYDAKGRAIALGALFPEKLPKGLGEQFDPERYSWGRESKRELLSLIAANPEHRKIIVRVWKSLFPHDEWINTLPDEL
jgi:hypothetical protein